MSAQSAGVQLAAGITHQQMLLRKLLHAFDWVDDGLIFDQLALIDNYKSPSQYINGFFAGFG